MQNKWKNFKAENNTELNLNKNNILIDVTNKDFTGDWQRQSGNLGFTINGIELKQFRSMFNDFSDKSDLRNFFFQIILKEFNGSEECKNKVADYLMKTFHQGGWLYPVSNALSGNFKDENGIPVFDAQSNMKNINIQLTKTGFIIQEMTEVNKLNLVLKDSEGNPIDTVEIQGSSPLIKAHATVSLDFSEFETTKEPSVTLVDSQLQFSNQRGLRDNVEKQMGLTEKSLGERIIHWIKEAFGLLPTIKSIAPEKPDEKLLILNKETVSEETVLGDTVSEDKNKQTSYHG